MPRYKVLSDKCTLGRQGATVTVDDDAPLNVRALVRSGHLAAVVDPPTKPTKKPKDGN